MTAPAQTPEIPTEFAHRTTLRRGEVAGTSGLSEKTVDERIADGTLRATRVGRTVLVIASDVWRMLGLCGECPEVSQEAKSILRRIA